MTTDEALEYCKRFDDPKLQSAMATDFSRATGTVGALLALRAELETAKARAEFLETSVPSRIYDELMDLRDSVDTLRGKLRELDASLGITAATWHEAEDRLTDAIGGSRAPETKGVARGHWHRAETVREQLRELGLITEARDGE